MPHITFIPFQFFFLGIFILFVITLFRSPKMSIPETITALNSVGSQPTALLVLVIGCMMLIECKLYGLDATIAGGIIGVASNMLTNMFAKSHTDSTGKTTVDVGTTPAPTIPPTSPTAPTASETPEVKS